MSSLSNISQKRDELEMDPEISSQENSTNPSDVERNVSSQCEDTVFSCDGDKCDLVSDNVRIIFQVVNFVIIIQIIDLFGTGTNIINMVCFVKQGVRDPVNIALLGLTVSELLSMITLIWHNICLNPLLYESDSAAWSPYTTQLTAGIPHVAVTRITCCITAFITLERCLCVVLPLKVQLIFTAKRVSVIVITIYIVTLTVNIVPFYYSTRFVMVPNPMKPNRTWLGITVTEDQPIAEKYSFAINNCLIPFSTFTIISISTVVMVERLMRTTNWRKTSTAPTHSNSISRRDQSVSKMVVVIAVMFIVCYTPLCGIFIARIIVPKFSSVGQYKNMNAVLISFAYILESVNASFNIFIYYSMSSRYRQAFREAVCFLRVNDQNNKLKYKP